VALTFLLLTSLMALGRLLAGPWALGPLRSGRVADVLNRLAISVFFPAAILRQAPGLTASADTAVVAVVPWLLLGVACGVGLVMVRAGADRGIAGCAALGLGFGNTAFLGYAVIPAMLGDDALRFAVVSDQLGSFIGVSTVGLVTISLAAGQERPTAWTMVRRVLLFPPFIALVVGVTLLPRLSAATLTSLGEVLHVVALPLLPGMAVAMGLRLQLRPPAHLRGPLLGIVVGKLVVMPAIALAIVMLLNQQGVARDVIVLQAGMPVMVTIGALLGFANVKADLAAAMVAFSTLASLLTLPLWHLLLQHV
jgi:predicted permease